MGDARERIARSLEQITGARKVAIKTAVEQLQATQGELQDVRERINTAKGILSRVRVLAGTWCGREAPLSHAGWRR